MPEELIMSGHGMCQGCGAAIAVRQILMEMTPKTIILLPPGCVAPTTTGEGAYRFRIPAVHIALIHGAAIAAGISAALKMKGLNDVVVLPLIGDGGTADIGLQALSAAAERNDDILYICIDNEAYMNTGRQSSSLTPTGAATTTDPYGPKAELGKDTLKKDVFLFMVQQKIPYAATTTPAYPQDLRRKIRRALQTSGFRYVHVLCPCPTGWGFPTDKTIRVGRLAVETGAFILAEAEHGKLKINRKIKKRKPIAEYIKLQRRFRHLKPEKIDYIQRLIDENYNYYLRLEEISLEGS